MAETKLNLSQTNSKLITMQVPNFTVVGSPTLSPSYVASDFSINDYLTSPNVIDTENNLTSFEIEGVYQLNGTYGHRYTGGIFASRPLPETSAILVTVNNYSGSDYGKLRIRISFDGTTHAIDYQTPSLTGKVYFKLTYSSTTGYAGYYQQGTNALQQLFTNATTTRPCISTNPYVWGLNNDTPLEEGSIYMASCKIKVNDVLKWQGTLTGQVPAIVND